MSKNNKHLVTMKLYLKFWWYFTVLLYKTAAEFLPIGNPIYLYVGCFPDFYFHNESKTKMHNAQMTITICTSWCRSFGYAMLYKGQHCGCFNKFKRLRSKSKSITCDSRCAGEPADYCGGRNAGSIYEIKTPKYLGCFKDKRAPRDLKVFTRTATTLLGCGIYCEKHGYPVMGLQNGKECRCGMNYGKYGKRSGDECNMHCKDDPFHICGGDLRNSIFKVWKYRHKHAWTKNAYRV